MSDRSEDGSVMEHDSCAGPSKGPTQILRSPISQGSSPVSKKAKVSPNPAPVARDAIRWIRHTLEEQSTKRSAMPVETQRNMFDMLTRLDAAVHDLVMTNLEGQSQLEEARRSSEICVAAAVAQFGAEMRLREAAHEQTLEAVVARLTEKEATRTAVPEAVIRVPEAMQGTEKGNTYSSVARRKTERSRDRNADRSRSRAAMRNKKLKEVRQEDHVPSYILNECPGKTLKDIKELIWSQVKAKKKNPKCHTVTTKTGKTILRPSDKETSDVLKHLSAVSSLIKVDSLRWPRVVVRGVSSDMDMTIETQRDILGQNPELEISSDTEDEVIRPIFKSGPRMRSTTTWVMEVNPKYYLKFEDTTLYIGFMRCRVSVYEEVTQCHICLRYGHPAAKCDEKEHVCAHCGRKGHKASDCPAAEAEPKCANCRGKHSARDKTCAYSSTICSQKKDEDDEDKLFCLLLVKEIKNVPENECLKLKIDVYNLILQNQTSLSDGYQHAMYGQQYRPSNFGYPNYGYNSTPHNTTTQGYHYDHNFVGKSNQLHASALAPSPTPTIQKKRPLGRP
ncbi:hypothetical protein QTP88_021161 [Uroleucon formosanum]